MTPFSFDEKTLKILSNFASIHSSMVIQKDKLSVVNNSNSCIGLYNFPEPYDFNEFGLYDTQEFLSAISVFETFPEINVKDNYLDISSKENKLKYFTTAKELIPKVIDLEDQFNKLDPDLVFNLSADKLALINKISSIIKSKYVFFESRKKKILITVCNELESSNNSYELYIDDIEVNNLEKPVKIELDNFKMLPGEYKIEMKVKNSKMMSRWSNLNGVKYFIAGSI